MSNIIDIFPVKILRLSNRFDLGVAGEGRRLIIERDCIPARLLNDGNYETANGSIFRSENFLKIYHPMYDLIPELQVECLSQDEGYARQLLISSILVKVECLKNLADEVSRAVETDIAVVTDSDHSPAFVHR